MEAVATAYVVSVGSGNNSTSPSVATNPLAMSQCLEMELALYITDGLVRMQSSIPAYFVANGREPMGAPFQEILQSRI
jgi:hypothetical protein